MTIVEIRNDLEALANQEKAGILRRFFKTGPGEYGEGDMFLGIQVPQLRKLAKRNEDITVDEAEQLLHSAFHEERLLALLILILKYKRGSEPVREAIYRLYLANSKYINNWDLVDLSAEHIVGAHLLNRGRLKLYRLAGSGSLWERRMSILATFHYVKLGDFADTLNIAGLLLTDAEDLIHKAVGWMLREIGKRDMQTEELFLQGHYKVMPRTMLRYAIEKFPEDRRKAYLRGQI